ncbi:MAG: hypothetical protein Q4P23_11185 [Micrococcaceae bacterium]|nr:hypothetical protein [Micrococcaceae bacterium]
MKSRAAATLLFVAALGLVGCAGESAAPGSAAQSADVAPTASVDLSASDTFEVEPVKVLDPEVVKSRAIANGRPIAAFDIECQVWTMPIAGTDEQAWANRLGSEFLASNNAQCPDQITFPYYFIESFGPGGPGELVVIAEDDLDRVSITDLDGETQELNDIATGVLDEVMDTNPDLEKVTVTLPPAGTSGTSDRREVHRVRAIHDE